MHRELAHNDFAILIGPWGHQLHVPTLYVTTPMAVPVGLESLAQPRVSFCAPTRMLSSRWLREDGGQT